MTNELPIKKIKGIRELQGYDHNPFLSAMGHVKQTQRKETIYNGRHAVVNMKTGEIEEDHLAMARVRLVDAEKFVKIYTANVSVFFELSRAAQGVCEFLIEEISQRAINTDKVNLYFEDYKIFANSKKYGSSENTFNRGMRELADKAMIAKCDRPYQWFINPAVIFNGDRARFITEIRKTPKSKQKELEEAGQISFLPQVEGNEDIESII